MCDNLEKEVSCLYILSDLFEPLPSFCGVFCLTREIVRILKGTAIAWNLF